MIQSAGTVRGIQVRQQVHKTGQHGQALAPAGLAVARAEVQPDPEGFGGSPRAESVRAMADLAITRGILRSNPSPSRWRWWALQVGAGGQVHPHLVAAHVHRKSAHVIGPLVESPAACQVETGVVPVAGENAVLERAALQGKAHVRAAVIYRVNFIDHQRRARLFGRRHLQTSIRLCSHLSFFAT